MEYEYPNCDAEIEGYHGDHTETEGKRTAPSKPRRHRCEENQDMQGVCVVCGSFGA